jgi:hypothetical protein
VLTLQCHTAQPGATKAAARHTRGVTRATSGSFGAWCKSAAHQTYGESSMQRRATFLTLHLSTLTLCSGQEFTKYTIRYKRGIEGQRRQHLIAVQAALVSAVALGVGPPDVLFAACKW